MVNLLTTPIHMDQEQSIQNLVRYANPAASFRGCASTCSLTNNELNANDELTIRNALKIAVKNKNKALEKMLLSLL